MATTALQVTRVAPWSDTLTYELSHVSRVSVTGGPFAVARHQLAGMAFDRAAGAPTPSGGGTVTVTFQPGYWTGVNGATGETTSKTVASTSSLQVDQPALQGSLTTDGAPTSLPFSDIQTLNLVQR